MNNDRFDLEQQILGCWNIVDEIKLLSEDVGDSDQLDRDHIMNYLLGLQTIYDMKFRKTFELFENLVKDRKIV